MDKIENQLFGRGHLWFKREPADQGNRRRRQPQAQAIKDNAQDAEHNVTGLTAQPQSQRKDKIQSVDVRE